MKHHMTCYKFYSIVLHHSNNEQAFPQGRVAYVSSNVSLIFLFHVYSTMHATNFHVHKVVITDHKKYY